MTGVRRLRGNDWRGADCDDLRGDVYPGRRTTTHGNSIDHNCNGIYGGNATGSYEDIFCANSQPRGIVILGDSATAHFHIPPQWLTANNWNLDQFLPDAENEIDQPHCSWGTGHVAPEDCPYQHPIPGVEGSAVISLYSQLRERNRCNHNDYQNIGVNGARITTSMQLANAMARDQQNDNPLLVWLALIGNDICNGHPTFETMTTPDEFYTHALETLNKLDTQVCFAFLSYVCNYFISGYFNADLHCNRCLLAHTSSPSPSSMESCCIRLCTRRSIPWALNTTRYAEVVSSLRLA